jgi:tRNA uridine 5-carbamoylmethylation protein Kti12
MVYWIIGKSSSGKTVYAYRLKKHLESLGTKVLLLDYDLDVSVIGHETGTICDKSLATVREDVSIDVPELERQLIIMKQFGGYKNVRNTTHER